MKYFHQRLGYVRTTGELRRTFMRYLSSDPLQTGRTTNCRPEDRPSRPAVASPLLCATGPTPNLSISTPITRGRSRDRSASHWHRYFALQYSEFSLISDSTEGQIWSVHELFGYMELSVLAVVTGEPSMHTFPNRPWEGISPREDVESAFPQDTPFGFVDGDTP